MIRDVMSIDKALGSKEKVPLPIESDAMFKMRKSIVLAHSLKQGHILSREDVEFKCPGNGITVNKLSAILGRTVCKDLPKEHVLSENDFK